MLAVDYVILGVVLSSMVIGAYRGFFPELLSLASWVVGVWVGWQFSSILEPRLASYLPSPTLTLWVSRFVLFAGVLLLGGLLTELVSLVIEKSGLTGTDRALGLAFGLARGVVIVGVLTVFAEMIELPREAWWRESKLMPYGERVAAGLKALLPEDVAQQLPGAPPASAPALMEQAT